MPEHAHSLLKNILYIQRACRTSAYNILKEGIKRVSYVTRNTGYW
jgi:hypothetical protein